MGGGRRKSKLTQVFLEDHWGSASQGILTVRSVLWGMVEHTARHAYDEERDAESGDAHEKKSKPEGQSQDLAEGALPETIDGYDGLPLQFGSKKQKQHQQKQQKKNKKRKRWSGRLPDVDHLPVLPHDDTQVIEHNIGYLQYHDFLHHATLLKTTTYIPYNRKSHKQEELVWLRVLGLAPKEANNENSVKVVMKHLPCQSLYIVDYHRIHFVHNTEESYIGYSHSEEDIWKGFYINKPTYDANDEEVHDKYWDQRYRIFSKYDEGIRLDAESWYSITYEIVAEHIANKCMEQLEQSYSSNNNQMQQHRLDLVLDCFSGCGGSAIPFAARNIHTIAVDIDPIKLSHLKHNSKLYGADHNIDCLQADVWNTLFNLGNSHRLSRLFTKLPKKMTGYEMMKQLEAVNAPLPIPDQNTKETYEANNKGTESTETVRPSVHRSNGKIDLVILSPPWGGPDYLNAENFDLQTMLTFMDGFTKTESNNQTTESNANETINSQTMIDINWMKVKDGITLVLAASAVAENIVYIVPRNTITTQLTILADIMALPYQIEEIMINNKAKVTVAYYGYLFKKQK